MAEVLIYTSVLTPIVIALIEVIKKAVNLKVNLIPLISLFVGLAIGYLGQNFTDLDLVNSLWAGALAGLSAVGLFEVGKKREGTTKEGE